MPSLEADLERARDLDVAELAESIQAIGFECTDCGACCRSEDAGEGCSTAEGESPDEGGNHVATVFPDEIRRLQETGEYDWRDVARPVPFGLSADGNGEPAGETFEWALQTDDCGDCTFYAPEADGGKCSVYEARPLVCRTYPFSVALGGTSQPLGTPVDGDGLVRAQECEGLGRDIDRADARQLAETLKARAIRDLEEAIAVQERYAPADPADDEVVVHDSEGAKRPDGRPYTEGG